MRVVFSATVVRSSAISCFSSVRTAARSSFVASLSSRLVTISTSASVWCVPKPAFSSRRLVSRVPDSTAYPAMSPLLPSLSCRPWACRRAVRGRADLPAGAASPQVGSRVERSSLTKTDSVAGISFAPAFLDPVGMTDQLRSLKAAVDEARLRALSRAGVADLLSDQAGGGERPSKLLVAPRKRPASRTRIVGPGSRDFGRNVDGLAAGEVGRVERGRTAFDTCPVRRATTSDRGRSRNVT